MSSMTQCEYATARTQVMFGEVQHSCQDPAAAWRFMAFTLSIEGAAEDQSPTDKARAQLHVDDLHSGVLDPQILAS
jgi:hypothetical protein